MAVEAEIKARVRDIEGVHAALTQRATGRQSVYSDRYFDHPDRRWTADGHELRVRTVSDADGAAHTLLTFKEPAVDEASGSKPEYETSAANPDVLVTVLLALGAEEVIAFEKQCTNYRFAAHGRELLATVVTVPELGGETFVEVETVAEANEVDAGLAVVRGVLAELGITSEDFTTEQYTDAVAARRLTDGDVRTGTR